MTFSIFPLFFPPSHSCFFLLFSSRSPFLSSARRPSDFRRRDTHLYYTHSISLADALLGFKQTLSHYDGHLIHLIRSGTTQPGFVQRIKGEGMPVRNPNEGSVWKEEDGFGDLFVQYEVVLPEKIEGDLKKGESWLFSCLEQV